MIIGACRAYWAYALTNILNIQSCIKEENNLYSPQSLINDVRSHNIDICKTFNSQDILISAFSHLQSKGIALMSELKIESDFSGAADQSQDIKEYINKIEKVQNIPKSKTYDEINEIK